MQPTCNTKKLKAAAEALVVMADTAGTVGVPGFEDSTAGNYPPFKPSEEAGAGATPTLQDLQALDSRGVAKGRGPIGPHTYVRL